MKMTYQTGLCGEKTASEWLTSRKGMKLLESRFRTKAGEIDLIMLDGETVVFVEVKTRLRSPSGSGLMTVDRKKQYRISRAAMLYLLKKGWTNRPVRFDAVEVNSGEVIHIPDAFQPGGVFFH